MSKKQPMIYPVPSNMMGQNVYFISGIKLRRGGAQSNESQKQKSNMDFKIAEKGMIWNL